MSVALLLEMAASDPDRVGVVSDDQRLTVGELNALADGGAGVIAGTGANTVVYVGTGGLMLPLLIFASARAARPFTPLNYRLSAEALAELVGRLPEPLVVFDAEYAEVAAGLGVSRMESADFLAAAGEAEPVAEFPDPDDVAVVLFTSGTTSRPKAVELSHNNLTSYVTGTVEFASAEPGDAALICVPPYHIAGVGAALSNLYAGRKMVYLTRFEPRNGSGWRSAKRSPAPPSYPPCWTGSSPNWRPTRFRCRPCGPWPTADRRSRFPWCARRSSCSPRSGSSTPTG